MASSILACVLLTVTLPPTIFAEDFNGKQCDVKQGEIYLHGPSGKRASVAACAKSCEDEPACHSFTFYSDGWCSHFSTRCEKRTSANAHAQRLKDDGFNQKECDVKQGEVWLGQSSGKRASVAECKKSCEDEPACHSITFYSDGWCSHFHTRCEKTTSANAHAERLKDDGFNQKECDVKQGEIYLHGPSGKRASLAECKKSCEDEPTCQSITFYNSFWCSHFTTRCEKTKTANAHAERLKDGAFNFNQKECDLNQGEVYLPGPSGKRASLAACKKSCEDERTCQSITFYSSFWCSHFNSPCEKTKPVDNAHAERLKKQLTEEPAYYKRA